MAIRYVPHHPDIPRQDCSQHPDGQSDLAEAAGVGVRKQDQVVVFQLRHRGSVSLAFQLRGVLFVADLPE
jgi:hypothetical protein